MGCKLRSAARRYWLNRSKRKNRATAAPYISNDRFKTWERMWAPKRGNGSEEAEMSAQSNNPELSGNTAAASQYCLLQNN